MPCVLFQGYDFRSGRQRKKNLVQPKNSRSERPCHTQKRKNSPKQKNQKKDKQQNKRQTEKITKKNGVKVNISCQFDRNQNPPVGGRQTFGYTWRDSLNYGIEVEKEIFYIHTHTQTYRHMYTHTQM